ncbi:MAG: Arc family DNA-binding protein [Paracoccaceae bacterium]
MARPKQSDPQFKLRIPEELKARITAAADASNRSVSSEILEALEIAFPPPDADVAEVVSDLNELQFKLREGPDHDELESAADSIDYIAVTLMKIEEKLRKLDRK